MTRSQFTLCLAPTLRSMELSWAQFTILNAIALAESRRGFATMPQIAMDAGISLNAVQQHLIKSSHLFLLQRLPEREGSAGHFIQINLADEAIELLAEVDLRFRRNMDSRFPEVSSETKERGDAA